MAPDKVRTTIVLTQSDKDALEKIAQYEDRSLNNVINRAIREYLKKYNKQP